jgi:hypothetical protein
MSALGQKQTSQHVRVMSALPPKADIRTWPALRATAPAAWRYSPSLLALVLFRLPRENTAGGYKYGHCRKKQAELHQWRHGGVSVARTPFR